MLEDGCPVTTALVQAMVDAEAARLAPSGFAEQRRFVAARALSEQVAVALQLIELLSLAASTELGWARAD
ncbi:MAG: hypothetical protein M0014_07180, partial [Actinomycetota bacterium]|nr:hypothetical protein [Actinomycetota bacterium]